MHCSSPSGFSKFRSFHLLLLKFEFFILIYIFILVGIIGGSGWKKLQRVLGTELPQLAKEVKQIETIRTYLGELGMTAFV